MVLGSSSRRARCGPFPRPVLLRLIETSPLVTCTRKDQDTAGAASLRQPTCQPGNAWREGYLVGALGHGPRDHGPARAAAAACQGRSLYRPECCARAARGPASPYRSPRGHHLVFSVLSQSQLTRPANPSILGEVTGGKSGSRPYSIPPSGGQASHSPSRRPWEGLQWPVIPVLVERGGQTP